MARSSSSYVTMSTCSVSKETTASPLTLRRIHVHADQEKSGLFILVSYRRYPGHGTDR